jgi:hypothetical protein
MSRRSIGVLVPVLALTLGIGPLGADDKWEFGSLWNDDTDNTMNVLDHGLTQTHDLQGTAASPDQDWMGLITLLRHSYEVRVSGSSMQWNVISFGCSACADLHRVDSSGTILTTATGAGSSGQALLRWIDTGDPADYVRATGSDSVSYTTNEEYDITFFDTTYFIPRWNNSASQFTVLIVRNNTVNSVTGNIYFYNPTGGLLHTEPLSLAPNATQVLNSAGIPALAGGSGSIAVAHLGGQGALSGKAVALEPGTGFTFDTVMVPFRN